MPAIRDLFDLQTVDLEIDARKARLAEIAELFGNEGPLLALRSQAKELSEALAKVSARQRDFDGAINEFSEHIAAVESKLYGGTVTNSRELTDLQADIDMIKRQRGDEEDQLLVVLEEMEGTQASSEKASAKLAEAEAAWQADQASMAEERGVLQAELAELEEQRNARAGKAPPPELALYEQVRKSHGGKAVARMRQGICDSCRVGLPNREVQRVKTSSTPVRCPSCGLILLAD